MLANPDGSSLSLFQTGEATTQKKKKKKYENDVHLIQDEQHFRLHSQSTCLLSNPQFVFITQRKQAASSLMKLFPGAVS